MDTSKDYYLILEVHPKASPEMIERAKRLLLQRYHPDHNPARLDWAAEQTRRVLEAFDALSDPARRAEYDRARQPQAAPTNRRTAPEPRPRTAPRPTPTPHRAKTAARAYSEAAQAASPPTARQTTPKGTRTPAIRSLPDGARLVCCQNCGRPSRIPKGVDIYSVRCGECRQPVRLSLGTRMRKALSRADARLDNASDALRRFLTGKPTPAKRSRREKSSR